MRNNLKIADSTRREPVEFIGRGYSLDPELQAATLKKMKELRKQKERKDALKRRAAKRAVLTAAIVALVILVTPLRGYVAAAAEEMYKALGGWMTEVSHVGMKKSRNGCSVEIIEVRVANDFLYLTIDEDTDEFLKKNPGEEVSFYYYGTIKDNKGNKIDFSSSSSMSEYITSDYIITSNRAYSYRYTYTYNSETGQETVVYGGATQYKFYMPDIKEIINSYDKKYTCEVNACLIKSSELFGIDAKSAKKQSLCGNMKFKFDINNVEGIMEEKEYEFEENSYKVDNFEFVFEKAIVSPYTSNIIVEIIPLNDNVPISSIYPVIKVTLGDEYKYCDFAESASHASNGTIFKVNSRYYTTLEETYTYGKSYVESMIAFNGEFIEEAYISEFISIILLGYEGPDSPYSYYNDMDYMDNYGLVKLAPKYEELENIELDVKGYNDYKGLDINKQINFNGDKIELDKLYMFKNRESHSHSSELYLKNENKEKYYRQEDDFYWYDYPDITEICIALEYGDGQHILLNYTSSDWYDGAEVTSNGEKAGSYVEYPFYLTWDDEKLVECYDSVQCESSYDHVMKKYNPDKVVIAAISCDAYHAVNPKYLDEFKAQYEARMAKYEDLIIRINW